MKTGDTIPPPAAERPLGEELLNAATHAGGLLLAVLGAVLIFRTPADWPFGQALACAAYVTTLIVVYAVSALSHAVQRPRAKHVLRVLDQGLIYLLIAGTYTPLMWAFLTPHLNWLSLTAVWVAASLGMYSKFVFQHRVSSFSTQSYLWLGWLPALALVQFVSLGCLTWLVLGGLSYSVGTVFLMRDHRRPYFHALWHLCVIGGSACHFWAIYRFALPQ